VKERKNSTECSCGWLMAGVDGQEKIEGMEGIEGVFTSGIYTS